MNNPIFVFEDVRGAATLTASDGSATGHPTTNLKDGRYDTFWESGGVTANQLLTAGYVGFKSLTSILIVNHNLYDLGLTSLDVEGSADGINWSLIYSHPGGFTDPLYISTYPTVYQKIDYRLKFVKSSALSVAPQIGLLYFGLEAAMPLYNNLSERGLQCDSVIAESMSGLRYSSSMHAERESWKLDFGKLNTLEAYNFTRLVRSVNGTQYPFWFYDINGYWHFVRFKKNYLPLISKGNVIFAAREIEFDEERVGGYIYLPGANPIGPGYN